MSLKQKLLSGQKIYGTMLRVVRNPAICLITKNAGFDFVMFDCEHSNYTMETLHDNYLLANSLGLGGFLRASELSKAFISRALDSGATGVMVPMTETVEQAKEIVKWSKYEPIGERGYCSGQAPTNYLMASSHTDAMKEGNNTVISIAQIETKLAVENAEDIAAIDGIDVLLIGPNDLSISLGIPGDFFNPIQLEAMSHVAAACKKHGKAFGMHAGASLLEKFANDLTFVMMQSDGDVLREGFTSIRKTLGKLGEK